MKRCDFYRDMVEAQNKVDRWNLKDESLSRASSKADCECTEVVTENVQRNVKTTYKNRQERFDYIKCILSYEWEDGRTALKNINLEIKKGEFVLISGKSGSGKSTLGSVMNGLIPHYYKGKMQGKAFVSGKEISKLLLHEIGHVG